MKINKIIPSLLCLAYVGSLQAAEILNCTLKSAKPIKGEVNEVSVKIDLNKLKDVYNSDGLDVGKYNYSFNMEINKEAKSVEISVVFNENNHVQDEVGSKSWTLKDLSEAGNKALIVEPLVMGDKKVAEFSCSYKETKDYQYTCQGRDSTLKKNNLRYFNLNVQPDTLSVFTLEDDNEVNLDLYERKDEVKRKFAIYADFAYDGYGGHIKVSIPKSVAEAKSTSKKPFTAYYEKDIYSEAGHVGSIRIKGLCKP